MSTDKVKILVVDDEEDLCEILQFNLNAEGFDTDVAFSAEEALDKKLDSYDLLLLDVMMGKMSGFRLAEKIRNELSLNTPIIFLTAKDTENDILTGFNLGADDYIPKPFSIKEMSARVKAVLKRAFSLKEKEASLIKIEGLELDLERKQLSLDKQKVNLTRKEFQILKLLLQHQTRIFTREEILYRIWEEDVIVSERTVDVNITRLRKKTGKYGRYIKSRSGYGYCFEINE